MADDTSHRCTLYFMEILMNSNGPVSISQLASRFGSKNFTAEMRAAAGENEVGLKQFLQQFPSLFRVQGNMVTLAMADSFGGMSPAAPRTPTYGRQNSTPTHSAVVTPSADPSLTFSHEREAVHYFQLALSRREENFVSIKSLAGHLSQANAIVREVVGPQPNFRSFLQRHPYAFDIQGDLVSLKEDPRAGTGVKPAHAHGALSRKVPYAKPPQRKKSAHATIKPPPPQSKQNPITMTANEYKTITFLKGILESAGPTRVSALLPHFERATEAVVSQAGKSCKDLENFLLDHPIIFELDEEKVASVKKHGRLNVIITGSRPQTPPEATSKGRKGSVYHVAKLWAIIDLGNHEHVFVDRQVVDSKPDDMRKVISIGDVYYFEGVQAPKGSRATWRATKVWKAEEEHPMEGVGSTQDNSVASSIRDFEKQLNCIKLDEHEFPDDPFADAAPSGAGVIAVWNVKKQQDGAGQAGEEGEDQINVLQGSEMLQDMLQIDVIPESKFLSMNVDTDSTYVARLGVPSIVPEEFMRVSSNMSLPKSSESAAPSTEDKAPEIVSNGSDAVSSKLLETPPQAERSPARAGSAPPKPLSAVAQAAKTSLTSGILAGKVQEARRADKPQMRDGSCQTVSTGDIIATQLYYD